MRDLDMSMYSNIFNDQDQWQAEILLPLIGFAFFFSLSCTTTIATCHSSTLAYLTRYC